jgi:hypothetical protein
MRKTLLFTALAAAAGVCAAQDVGRVVSSSPIYRQVEVPQQVCTTEEVQVRPSQWQPQQNCRTQSRFENRAVGYNVTYEYAGRRYDTQTATPPGSTIPLRVSAMGVSSLAPPLPSDGSGPATAGAAYGSADAGTPQNGSIGSSYSTLQAQEPDQPVQVQPGVVVPTTTYTTVRRVVQPAAIIIQPPPPPPVYLTPAYPAYPAYSPAYGPGYGSGYGGGYYPGTSAWAGIPLGLSLNLGYSRGRWR